MSVRELSHRPDALACFTHPAYRFLELHDDTAPYAHAAIAERGRDLELHVTFARWGPDVRRRVKEDVQWLRGEARRLGKERILGVRISTTGTFDPGLFRFAALYGFTDVCVLQTAAMSVV